jgi:hypothetical protein
MLSDRELLAQLNESRQGDRDQAPVSVHEHHYLTKTRLLDPLWSPAAGQETFSLENCRDSRVETLISIQAHFQPIYPISYLLLHVSRPLPNFLDPSLANKIT